VPARLVPLRHRRVEINIAFTKRFGAGLFGGEGFILEKLSGSGTAMIHAGGNLVEFDLVAGQAMRVDTGCIVAFEEAVRYDIQFVGGFKNALFGGEGLFLAELTGPASASCRPCPSPAWPAASWASRARDPAASPAWAARCATSATSSGGTSRRRMDPSGGAHGGSENLQSADDVLVGDLWRVRAIGFRRVRRIDPR
jgi:hypothetical protein